MNLLFSKSKVISIGANSHIKSQLNSLNIERDILTKTISRLYQQDVDLSKIQRDRLLIRYQHQLGIVLAKIEKLEAASKHPDLGPLGDGLITLMDQKLSQLDKRLYELTSKINVANMQIEETKPKIEEQIKKPKEEIKKIEVTPQIQIVKEIPQVLVQPKPRAFEITTLTELPSNVLEFPLIEQKPREIQMEIIQEQIEKPQPKAGEKSEILQTSLSSIDLEKSEIMKEIPGQETLPVVPEHKPKPTIKLPDEENIEDDDEDDLDRIKGEKIDVVFDGADQIDEQKNLIKGGGGALLRENILINAAKKVVIMADKSKFVKYFNRTVPVEVHPLARNTVVKSIHTLGGKPKIRTIERGYPFITENGNVILDCDFGVIKNPKSLAQKVKLIPGVMEVGIFTRKPDVIYKAKTNGKFEIIT